MNCSTQPSLSFTISQSLLKLMSIESVMPSNHLICCHPLSPPSRAPIDGNMYHVVGSCISWFLVHVSLDPQLPKMQASGAKLGVK